MTSRLLDSCSILPRDGTQDLGGWRKGIDSGFRCKIAAIGMNMGVRLDSGSSTYMSSDVNG